MNTRQKGSKELKRPIIIDFDNVDIGFYSDFVNFLTDKGRAQNTIGKHITSLKLFMRKSLIQELHTNRKFMDGGFVGISRDSFNIMPY